MKKFDGHSPVLKKITLQLKEEECTAGDIINQFENSDQILALRVNGLLQSLNSRINKNCCMDIEPVYRTSVSGEAILRRSLVFLLAKAMYELKPEKSWRVEHQLDNAYYCKFEDESVPSEEFLKTLSSKMYEIANKNYKIRERSLYHQDALKYFAKINLQLTIKLIRTLNRYQIRVDEMDGFMQMHHRVLVGNSSELAKTKFKLTNRSKGWALIFKYSKWRDYYQPSEMGDDRIIEINNIRNEFVRSVNIQCVGDVNSLVLKGEDYIDEFVQLNKLYQDMELNRVIRIINKYRREKGCRVVLIAGPSASGKTTFAKKLRWSLKTRGIKSHTLSVDNYFKAREDSPRDPVTGKYDFERLDCLRVDKMNSDMEQLFKGDSIYVPHFDFKTGLPNDKGELMCIEKESILIMEGIHCLNDKLTPKIARNLKFKIFLAPFTPIKLEDRNYISNKVIRLIRRIVRDEIHRGYGIEFTLGNWPHVLRGEHMYIFPFIKSADFIFNSALDYEISVLKPYASPMLKSVSPSSEFFDIARELYNFLKKFESIPYKYVPRDSILQEFLGGHWRNT